MMHSRLTVFLTAVVACATIHLAVTAPTARAQVWSKVERTCIFKLAKLANKLGGVVIKGDAKCHRRDIAGPAQSCPMTKSAAKADKLQSKMITTGERLCGSTCSVSGLPCVETSQCPPVGSTREKCTAGPAARPFDLGNLGFPGAFCATALGGGHIENGGDLAECISTLTRQTAHHVADVVYGSIDNGSGVSADARKCLKGVSTSVRKLISKIYKGVLKCRDGIVTGETVGNPTTCLEDDAALAEKVAKFDQKLAKTVAAKCTPASITELDLCGNGPGGTLDQAAAVSCLTAAAHELADTTVAPTLRQHTLASLIDAAFPPPASCGDNVINQIASPALVNGEECDGADDSACPGDCFPPGDVFECTCATIPRTHFFADGFTADLDTGWTGTSHNSRVADLSGFVTEVNNCDCDEFIDATCVGTSGDPLCDSIGDQLPTCSWDPNSTTRCDARGDNDGNDEDEDCFICDQFNVNAGAFCGDESNCQAQCFDGSGTPTGTCSRQSDCAAGETCRGQCDQTQSCILLPNGSPLPLSAGGTPVCNVATFREDVYGTINIETGEQETYVLQNSKVHLGNSNGTPCPICGGFCNGGPLDGEVCEGTCSTSGTACRFPTDCPSGEVCTGETADCPDGTCILSQVCSSGPNQGKPCQLDGVTASFGITSNDCPPPSKSNISGNGIFTDFNPSTSEVSELPFDVPCTAAGFELFGCPCPDDGGDKTKPNGCRPACNTGAELGQGCADGNTAGQFTTCAGGSNAGKACDEDSDCAPGTCSDNPLHCTGDESFEHFSCTTNADCGAGTCVDSCPSGRCVPLCLPDPSDPEDGLCAAGPPIYRCDGANNEFRACSVTDANGSCSATCSMAGTPCTSAADCPSGETCQGPCDKARDCEAGVDGVLGTSDDLPGAGLCQSRGLSCFLAPISAEGGDIFNGKGDATNVFAVSSFCIPATNSPPINNASGLGGPGRIRVAGVRIPNFTALPTEGACCDAGICEQRASAICEAAGHTFVGGPCTPNPCP
jgi:hypothetical protein